jgi:cold shock CspA family protein
MSNASNLVSGDTNASRDIFVHDRLSGQTTRVSVASDGTQGNRATAFAFPAISGDGRYVAFGSEASNLVPGDTYGPEDIFVHDRQTGQTTRVSRASDGAQGNGDSISPSVSGDGRYVAFMSFANNLAPDNTSGSDIFVHDRQTGQTTKVSIASDGTQGIGFTDFPAISGNGRYIAFMSFANNLVPGDTNNIEDIFVHDRQTGQTTRVSVTSDGTQGNSSSNSPAISGDGRYVAFRSFASNLISGDTNGTADIFVHDRQTGQTTRVSVASDGTQGDESSIYSPSNSPALSSTGRYFAFASGASNLVPGDTNGGPDIFVHNRGLPPSGKAKLSGRVTNVEGTPLTGILAQAYSFNGSWNLIGGATTTTSGIYTIENLPAGTYRVHFVDFSGRYQHEYYNNQPNFNGAINILLTEGSTTPSINAVLAEIPPPPIKIGAGCGQIIIDPETGQVTIRLPRLCHGVVKYIVSVVCANGNSPTGVTFLLNDKAFPMTTVGGGLYQVSLNLPADLVNVGNFFTFRVTAQCGPQVETPVEGEGERYDPSGFITDAKTGQAIKGAVVNLYQVPQALPDEGNTLNGSCRTVNTRPASVGGRFGAWSGLSSTSLNTAQWVNPALVLINNTGAISPAVNPQTTGVDGYYGWDVLKGCWYIEVRTEGYQTLVSPLVGVPPAVTDLNLSLTKSTVYLPLIFK